MSHDHSGVDPSDLMGQDVATAHNDQMVQLHYLAPEPQKAFTWHVFC